MGHRERARHLGGDALAHLRHRQQDFVGALGEFDRGAGRCDGRGCAGRGRGGCGTGRAVAARPGRCAGGRRGGAARADRLDDLQDVLAGDPATATGALDLGRGEVVLAEEPADGGRHAGIRVGDGRRRGGCRRSRRVPSRTVRARHCRRDRWPRPGSGRVPGRRARPAPPRARPAAAAGSAGCEVADRTGRRGGLGRVPGAVVGRLDDRDLGVVRDRRAFLDEDLAQDALERRRHLGVDLVGDDLDERLVLRDMVARLLEPFPDRPLGNALAELGHRHLGHVRRSSEVRAASRGRAGSLRVVSPISGIGSSPTRSPPPGIHSPGLPRLGIMRAMPLAPVDGDR